jgi:hypothetical protein
MQFFKHMANMHDDPAIKRLISTYGLEGYGLYCLVLELVTSRVTNDSPIPGLDESAEDLSEFYNCERAGEILEFIVEKKLFLSNGSGLECPKVYKFFQSSQTRSPAIRSLIEEYSRAQAKRLQSETVTYSHRQSQTVTDSDGKESSSVTVYDNLGPSVQKERKNKGSEAKLAQTTELDKTEDGEWKEDEEPWPTHTPRTK